MIIAVFGGSGNIGSFVLEKALNNGQKVKAYVRSPKKILINRRNLEIELNEYEKIKQTIRGVDVVISALGPSMSPKAKGFPILEGHENIVRAMKAENIKRFITLATPSIKFKNDKPSLMTRFPGIIARLFLPRAYKEIVAIGEEVKRSDLDWTIVRIISPTDKEPTGSAKVSFGGKGLNFGVSREDIAGFMLKQATDNQFVGSMPIIINIKKSAAEEKKQWI